MHPHTTQQGTGMRTFPSGATRDDDVDKHDPEGFLSSLVVTTQEQYLFEWLDITWAAGLFEGEGCISKERFHNRHKDGSQSAGYMPILTLSMTDEDSVRRFHHIVEHGKVYFRHAQSRLSTGRKPLWVWRARGRKATSGVAFVLYPFLGERRKARMREIFGSWVAHGEIGSALPPDVIEAFNRYMHKHRYQADGSLRASDNWARGIPRDAYMKSLWRHVFDVWKHHRGLGSQTNASLTDSLCAVLFNAQGLLHEHLARHDPPGDPTAHHALSWSV